MGRVWLCGVLFAAFCCACSREVPPGPGTPTPPALASSPAADLSPAPAPPALPQLDQRVVQAVITGQRAASYEVAQRAYRWWFVCHLARHDWQALETQARLAASQPARPIPPASAYFLTLVEARKDRDLLVGQGRYLELCRDWLVGRPEVPAARTAFARVALEELWSKDQPALLQEVRKALDPAFVAGHPDPELVCALLELDLLEGVDNATWSAHRGYLKAPYFGATLLEAARGSVWFTGSAKPWYSGIEPGQRALTALQMRRAAFTSSAKRKSRLPQLVLPAEEEAASWKLLLKNTPELDFHLRNEAARALLKGAPEQAALLLEQIGPNPDLTVWKAMQDYQRARQELLGGSKGDAKLLDPTYDLLPLRMREAGLEGVLLSYQVLELLLRGQAEEMQTVGGALFNEEERLPNGLSKFVTFLEAVSPYALGTEEHRRQLFETLSVWQQAYPESDLPRLATGYARINEANPAGLFGVAESTPELDQQKLESAQKAEDLVRGITRTSPFYRHAQLLRLLTHRDLGLPIEPLLEDLLTSDLTLLELYRRVASYAYARDPERLLGWMDQCVRASQDSLGQGAYALMADVSASYEAVDRVPLDWTRIDLGYADLSKLYSSWTLPQRRLFWAVTFQKRARAEELAQGIGLDKLDFRVFDGWNNLDSARKWLRDSKESRS